jgi:uncharacterized protein YbjT (DUF2867 family)
MNVVVFGASGMVGGGVVLECLDDPRIEKMLAVGRSSCGIAHAKLQELVVKDLFRLDTVADRLRGYDACFWCLGVSAAGMSEAAYRRITYDLTLTAVGLLAELNPRLVVCFVSGQGTDATGRSRMMWARVKGETENALLGLPVRAHMFRPGFIRPLRGVKSRTRLYRALYTVLAPVGPLLERMLPGAITTTEQVGRAMIRTALEGHQKDVLATADINAL